MKIPRLPLSLSGITNPFKKDEQDQLDEKSRAQQQEVDGKPPFNSFFRNGKSTIQLVIERQLRTALKKNPLVEGVRTPNHEPLREKADGTVEIHKPETAAELSKPRKMAIAIGRTRRPLSRHLFAKGEIDIARFALQKWVVDAKDDLAELETRRLASEIFVKVLHDPSMNIPNVLLDRFDLLSEEIQNAVRKIQAYHHAGNNGAGFSDHMKQ